ncbi:Microtubule-actin cross-linking factor 1 [Trichinella nativa]|uniref:Microtubule-actin cross-linking factor 1 n=1 Tax=Trichinella nativa TaxID=6335 RepID=A0A0V1LDV9_9BILA|nr:Microtubule-actin cross-linking factor 1 [Trichinella nativa]
MLTDTLTLIYQTEKLPHDIAGNFIEKLYDNSTIEDHFQENDEKNRTLSVQKNRLFLDERSGQLCQATIGKWFLNERFSRCSTLNTACSNQRQYCGVNFNLRKSYELKLSKLVPSQSIILNPIYIFFASTVSCRVVIFFTDLVTNVAVSIGCAIHSGLFSSRAVALSFDASFGRVLVASFDRRRLWCKVVTRMFYSNVCSLCMAAYEYWGPQPLSRLCRVCVRPTARRPLVFRLDALRAFASPVASASSRTYRFFSTKSGADILRTHFRRNRLVDMTYRGRGNAFFQMSTSSSPNENMQANDDGDPEEVTAETISKKSGSTEEESMLSVLATAKAERANIQKKAFTVWMNRLLESRSEKVNDLFVDLKDGTLLLNVLELLTGKQLKPDQGLLRIHHVQNVSKVLNFLIEENVKLVNMRPEHIVDGNENMGDHFALSVEYWVWCGSDIMVYQTEELVMASNNNGTVVVNWLLFYLIYYYRHSCRSVAAHSASTTSTSSCKSSSSSSNINSNSSSSSSNGNSSSSSSSSCSSRGGGGGGGSSSSSGRNSAHWNAGGCFWKTGQLVGLVSHFLSAYGTGVDGSSVLAREQSDDTVRFFCHDHHRSQQQQHYHYYLLRQTDACCLLVECVWLSLYNCALFLIGFLLLFGLSAHLMYKILKSYHRKAERKHEVTCEPLTLSPQSRVAGHQQQHQQQRSTSSTVIGGGSNDSHHHHHGNGKNGSGSLLVAAQPSSGADWRAGSGATAPQILTGGGAGAGGGYSESSSYETHAHYERKVQRVKKTRSDRDRSSNRRSTDRRLVKVSEPWHEVERRGGFSAKEGLLNWVQDVTSGYSGVNVHNFTTSWRDGLAFNAILHRFRPDLVKWSEVLHRMKPRERLENAFELFEKEFQVSRLLDPEDVDVSHPEEKSLTVYISMLYNALSNLEMPNFQDEVMRYRLSAREFSSWLQRAINSYQNTSAHPSERLLAEIDEFRKEEVRNKHREKERLEKEYADLEEKLSNIDVFSVEHEFTPGRLNRLWEDLLDALAARERALGGDVRVDLDELARNLNLQIGITNEKLDELLQQIEAADNNTSHDSVDLIVDGLNALESPIEGFFHDVDVLRSCNHPQANDFYRQVFGLHQRRIAYLQRCQGCLQLLDSSYVSRTERERLCRNKTQIFTQVCDYIQWVEQRIKELSELEFSEKLSDLDSMLEKHKLDHAEIMDFRTTVEQCIARQADIPAEDTDEYCNYLSKLEGDYSQLKKLSTGRMLDLDMLTAFVRAAQLELMWIQEREVIEVTRNWSDFVNLDLSMLQNYYKQLMHEIELREAQFNDVHDQGAALLNQRHPAVEVIELYVGMMQAQWDWLLGLTQCLEVHLQDSLNLSRFLEDVSNCENWFECEIQVLTELSNRRFNYLNLDECESMLAQLKEMRAMMDRYSETLISLSERSRTLSPLWQRGERITTTILVTALCNYLEKDIVVHKDDECILIDNSDLVRWRVQFHGGVEFEAPSVIFRIPPPDTRVAVCLQRLQVLFDRMRRLWLENFHSIRFMAISDSLRKVRSWDLKQFLELDPASRDGLVSALNNDANELLAELDEDDPLSVQLRDELNAANEHFYRLIKLAQREPDPDVVENFDRKAKALLQKLDSSWKTLMQRIADPIPRTADEWDKATDEHKAHGLQALDSEMSMIQELFRQILDPSPMQRALLEQVLSRWENLWETSKMHAERLNLIESATGVLMQYQSAYENENAWLERVEKTIDDLRIDESINPEEYQKHLDLLMAEYRNLTERTEAVEHVNREGGRFIREAKTYDSRISQYRDSIMERNPTLSFGSYSSMSGHRQVAKDLEDFNRRFSQLASVILERRNVIQVWMQSYRRRRELPKLDIKTGRQFGEAMEWGEAGELEETGDLAGVVKVSEHEDDMIMYAEETEIRTKFFELEAVKHLQTGEILTFVEAARQGVLDLKSGEFFDVTSGSRMSLEEAVRRGFVSQSLTECLNSEYGIHDPETRESITLMEAIRRGIYDPELRQLKNPRTGELLSLFDASTLGVITMDNVHRLIKMGILKLPPLHLQQAIEQAVIDLQTGTFIGRFSRETLPLTEALRNGYVTLSPTTQPGIGIALTECIEQRFIDANTGVFDDRVTGEKISLRDAVSKKTGLVNLHYREVVNTSERRRVTVEDALFRNVLNTRLGNYTDTQHRQTISLSEAYERELIQQPLTLFDVNARGLIDSTGRFVDAGTKRRMVLLEAIADGLLEPDVPHIVDSDEGDVVSIAVALERGLLTPTGEYVQHDPLRTISIQEAVNKSLIVSPLRYSFFDIKGIKDTKANRTLSFNEALDAGVIVLSSRRLVDTATNDSYMLDEIPQDCSIVDSAVLSVLNRPSGLIKKDHHHQSSRSTSATATAELTVLEAVARGVIDSKKAVLLNSRQQHFSPRQAYESGLISLRGALLMSALFNVHPGLVMPSGGASGKSSRSSARKRTPRRVRDFAAQPGLKMTLAEALHQGLVDPLKQTVVEDGREMTLQQAVDFGFIDMSTQWIVPDQGNKGPTIQESQSEEVTETSQVLAPKDTTDKHVEETVTTVKRQRITETTAVGGGAGSGVSAYRAITSRGQGGRLVVPVEGMHIYDAQRKGLLDLNTGMLTVPDVDRKLTFEEAIDLGIVNSGHLQVRGGRRGALNAAEAIEQGLLDPTGFHVDPLTKERRSLQAAIDADLVLVEPESLPDTRQSTKVIQFGLGASRGGAVLSFNPTGTSTREESELGWSFNSTTGEVVDEQTGERFSLDEALRRGKVAEEDFRVVDALTERELTFSDAEKWGVIESTSKMYVNKRDARVCSLQEAAKQGLLFYLLGMPQYARDTVETRVRRQSRRVVSNKESALAGPAAFVDYSLQKVIDLGWYDSTSGLFTHPDTKKQMSLRQAIIRGLFNPYECSIRHPATGERISLLDAIQVGLIDADRGLVVDSRSGRTYDLRQACQEGIICSGVVPQSLEAAIACGRLDLSAGTVSFPDGRTALSLHDAVASGVIDPASIRVLDPASGREMSFAEAVAERVVNLSRGLVLNKSTGEASSLIQAIRSGTLKPVASADTRRYSSSAAGSQEQQLLATSGTFFGSLTTAGGDVAKTSVMVKVIRDEQGVEKGEYVDPETKMKFTIQLHGDPYTTRAQTSVKSTAQVQSVELSPFVELVGIDKVLDKRTGRVMTLAEAQRAGLASVDRKGKQLTKSYAVFRSDLAHALAKGVVDPTTGERLSLEDAIKSRLIDIGNLVLWHPDSSSMDLAQAANVGLIDVTLAEVLPKGVCHPVSGERISTKRAIELKIINARTGEVCNPYSNERLTWLSIVKPVYASLVMEGVYDPRKGYAVPLSRALIEGLIDARARTYCNPITGEVLSLDEASGHGLVDEGTYKLILQPLIRDYRRTAAGEEMLCLLDAVRVGLVDPHARTVVVDRGATVPIANAVREGKFPRELGRLMRRVDKWTFAEALGQGLIDVAANQFTDPDSGQKLTIAAALQQGYIDTGSVEALEGADERNLSNVLESDEFDEHSGRIRDRRTGLYLTFKQAIERGIIDGDSLIYDVTAGRALTLNEALLKGRIDNSGKFVDSKTAARVSLKDAARVGLLALIASPMLAGQAAAEAIKRREAEGYRFAVEPSRFFDELRRQNLKPSEWEVFNPATGQSQTLEDAVESGLLDLVSGELIDPNSGQHYSIPKAVHLRWLSPAAGNAMMASLNKIIEQRTGERPDISTAATPGLLIYTREVSWRGQPSELRASDGDLPITGEGMKNKIDAWINEAEQMVIVFKQIHDKTIEQISQQQLTSDGLKPLSEFIWNAKFELSGMIAKAERLETSSKTFQVDCAHYLSPDGFHKLQSLQDQLAQQASFSTKLIVLIEKIDQARLVLTDAIFKSEQFSVWLTAVQSMIEKQEYTKANAVMLPELQTLIGNEAFCNSVCNCMIVETNVLRRLADPSSSSIDYSIRVGDINSGILKEKFNSTLQHLKVLCDTVIVVPDRAPFSPVFLGTEDNSVAENVDHRSTTDGVKADETNNSGLKDDDNSCSSTDDASTALSVSEERNDDSLIVELVHSCNELERDLNLVNGRRQINSVDSRIESATAQMDYIEQELDSICRLMFERSAGVVHRLLMSLQNQMVTLNKDVEFITTQSSDIVQCCSSAATRYIQLKLDNLIRRQSNLKGKFDDVSNFVIESERQVKQAISELLVWTKQMFDQLSEFDNVSPLQNELKKQISAYDAFYNDVLAKQAEFASIIARGKKLIVSEEEANVFGQSCGTEVGELESALENLLQKSRQKARHFNDSLDLVISVDRLERRLMGKVEDWENEIQLLSSTDDAKLENTHHSLTELQHQMDCEKMNVTQLKLLIERLIETTSTDYQQQMNDRYNVVLERFEMVRASCLEKLHAVEQGRQVVSEFDSLLAEANESYADFNARLTALQDEQKGTRCDLAALREIARESHDLFTQKLAELKRLCSPSVGRDFPIPHARQAKMVEQFHQKSISFENCVRNYMNKLQHVENHCATVDSAVKSALEILEEVEKALSTEQDVIDSTDGTSTIITGTGCEVLTVKKANSLERSLSASKQKVEDCIRKCCGPLRQMHFDKDADNCQKLIDQTLARLQLTGKNLEEKCISLQQLVSEGKDVRQQLIENLRSFKRLCSDALLNSKAAVPYDMKEIENLLLRIQEMKHNSESVTSSALAIVDSSIPYMSNAVLETSMKEELETLTQALRRRVKDFSNRIESKEKQLEEARSSLTNFLENLKNMEEWLCNTELLIRNQKVFSSNPEVIESQLREQEMLGKLLDDKSLFWEEISKACSPPAGSKLARDVQDINRRFSDMKNNQESRMSILKVAFEIACIWNNYFTVLADWLQVAEAQVNDIGYVTTDEDSITKQFEKLKVLEKEFEESGNHLEKVMHFGQQFQDLLCDSEAAIVGEQMSSHSNRYQKLYSTVENLSELLSEMQQGVLSLTERIDDVDSWLNDLAERLNSVPPIDDIQVDVLSKQSQQIMCVAEEISRFQIRVAKLMEFGHEMCKNMPDDEAETIQHRLELLHLRYAELSDTADERMLVLQDAFSAAWEFSAAHTTLSEWLSAVEEDLVQIDEVSICQQLELINNIESDTTEMRELMEKMATMGDKLNYFCSSEGKAEICRISTRIKSRYSNVCEQLEQLCERSSTAKEEWQRVMAALDGLIDWLEPVEKKIKQGAVFSADLNIARDTLERHRMLQEDIVSQRTRANDILLLGNKVSKLLNPDDRQFLVEKMEKLRALSDAVIDCSCSLLEHLEELVATITCFDEAYKELDAWLTSEESEVECMHLLQDDGMHDIVEVNKRIWKNISDGYIMVEKLEKYRLEVKKLACAEDAARIAKLTSQLTSRYENLKNTFKMRADVIESTQVHSGKVIYQLDGILESLNDCKERFNSICSRISDRPELLSRQIEENMALLNDLERKQTLCHSLINGIDCDDEVKMLSDKANLIKLLLPELFSIITSHTYKLHETLRVAGSFWNLYAACMEQWKPIESQLSSSESATCEALCLIDMRDQLIRMKAQFSDKQASAESCEKLGNQLLKLVGDEFKSNVVETVRQLKTTNQRITDLLNKRDQEIEYKLNKADSMTQLSDHILIMLKNVEDQINNFQDISDQLEQLNEQFQEVLCLKDQLDAVTVLVEQLKQLCETFCSGSPVTDVSYARHAYETISSHLKLLYSIASSRHQDLEKALLQVGCAQVALDQMINWIEKTTGTVHELCCRPGDIKSVDLQLAVLRAVANDVAAHRATMAEVTDAVTRNCQFHPDQSSEQSSMVEKVEIMQSKWDTLMASIDVKLSELEYSKQETFRFLDMFVEWQVWMSDVESAISNGRHVGGLPDTAKEQLEKFQLIVADVASKKSTIDSAIVDALDYTRDNSALQSPLFAEIQKFETRWKLLQKRVEEHSQKLERALKQAIEFDSLVTECSCWQQRAEQYLNHLEPASRLKAKLKTQMEQHLTFCEEIDTRRQQMLTLDGCGTRMKYTCRRPDATLIKNQLATMLTSWSKILTRAADRSKQLDTVSRSCTSFFDQLEQLNCKFDQLQDQFQQLLVQQHLSPGGSGSGGGGFSVEHLVQALDQLSMFQGQLSALSADLDRIAAQGRQLREHAIAEEQQVIGDAVSAARDKWNGLNGALLERQARLEQALLFNGQLEEAVDVLMVWLRQAEELLDDDERVGGDVDTLLELDERLQTLRSGLQSRESSIASIRDMRHECSSTNEQRQQQQQPLSDSIVEKVDMMLELWDTVSRLVDQRHAALCKSRADAERLKTDCGALFEWLAQAETRARPTEQNCERRIAALEHLIEEIDSKRGSVDEVLELGRRIRAVCHPKAEKPLERCLTALEARYAQTLQMVRQRLLRLKSDLDQEKQLDVDLKLLLDWVQKMQAKIDSLQDNLPSYTPGTADVLDEQHRKIAELIERQLMFEVSLHERQREVDEATADFRTVEAEQLGLVTPGAAASRPKNARTAQLVAAWRKLWLGCISYKNGLNERLHYIIEMKQLSGFSFEDWRRRYVRWMAERKCRAVDLFKRYDCDGDGRLTCDQFRDAILNSRFKTSKAEMDLVVEAIDRNHDGFVDMTEFLHALRTDSEHFTDDKKITEEIAKQLNLCSCKQKYRVEEVRPGRCYRLGERLKLVRIYRSTVMVRVGGGWQTFQEFMSKNDPCRAKGRTNLELREQFILPEGGSQAVWLFRRKNVKPEKAAKLTSGGTSYGPVTKIREKTERSMPMCSTGGAVAGNASVADNVCETSPAEPSSITACDAGDHSSSQANLPANTDASGVTSPHRSSEREIDTAETSKRRKEQRTSSAATPSSLQPPSTSSSSSHRKNNTTTGRGRRGGRSRKNF